MTANRPQDRTQPTVLVLLVAVAALTFGGLAYVTYQHPSFALLTVAPSGMALFLAVGLTRR
ncbi:hypothetical protein OG413_27830 [Streptomyces sp. NBC_01433]|uniref:hypothetical protein n=1 Tax=Streptomyces sp. NBC_01433 TaxID=2903864 RepID=UPI002255C464|nr:hypothetical protein [Streptomyces sp. NBC_01433]MCX4679071.1 hypothetical protein [Streptomyces sp. NBC_01433]